MIDITRRSFVAGLALAPLANVRGDAIANTPAIQPNQPAMALPSGSYRSPPVKVLRHVVIGRSVTPEEMTAVEAFVLGKLELGDAELDSVRPDIAIIKPE